MPKGAASDIAVACRATITWFPGMKSFLPEGHVTFRQVARKLRRHGTTSSAEKNSERYGATLHDPHRARGLDRHDGSRAADPEGWRNAIEKDRIAAIGPTRDVASKFTAEKTINASGKLVIPGLIDTHVHSTQQLGRGLADGCDIAVHLLERLYGYESEVLHDDAYWAALCCQLEMIRAGTTCFLDPGSYFPEQTAKAAGDSGMRGIVARTAVDIHKTAIGALPEKMFRETKDEAVAKSEQPVKDLNGLHDGRIRAWFSLRLPSRAPTISSRRSRRRRTRTASAS